MLNIAIQSVIMTVLKMRNVDLLGMLYADEVSRSRRRIAAAAHAESHRQRIEQTTSLQVTNQCTDDPVQLLSSSMYTIRFVSEPIILDTAPQ